MKTVNITIVQGLPGSGKSTFCKAWALEKPEERARVSRDDIRDMLGVYWVPSREDLVTLIEKLTVSAAIAKGFDVILDATNFNPNVKTWMESLKQDCLSLNINLNVQWKLIDTPIEECIKRDARRERSVGEKVIRRFHSTYLRKPEPQNI